MFGLTSGRELSLCFLGNFVYSIFKTLAVKKLEVWWWKQIPSRPFGRCGLIINPTVCAGLIGEAQKPEAVCGPQEEETSVWLRSAGAPPPLLGEWHLLLHRPRGAPILPSSERPCAASGGLAVVQALPLRTPLTSDECPRLFGLSFCRTLGRRWAWCPRETLSALPQDQASEDISVRARPGLRALELLYQWRDRK